MRHFLTVLFLSATAVFAQPQPRYQPLNSVLTEVSNGASAKLDLSGSAVSMPIRLPATASIQGIEWGNGLGVTIGYETVQKKLRLTASRIDLLPDGSLGQSFVQMLNNGFDNSTVFISSQGTATALLPNRPGHRFGLTSSTWTGSAAADKHGVIQGNNDGTNGYISIFADGSLSQPAYPFSEPPATGGTETTRFTVAGVDVRNLQVLNVGNGGITFSGTGAADTRTNLGAAASGANTNITTLKGLTAANASPSVTGSGVTTSGIGFFGSEVQIVRAGSIQAYTDPAGFIIPTLFSTAVINAAAGSAGFPSITRSSNNGTGIWWPPVTNEVGFSAGGAQVGGADASGLYCGTTAAKQRPIIVLSQTISIDAKSTGTTNLYTVPTGKFVFITGAVIRCTTSTALTVGPTIGIGIASGEDDIFASTALTTFIAIDTGYEFSTSRVSKMASSTNVIKLGIDTAATGTAMTVAVDLLGYFIN